MLASRSRYLEINIHDTYSRLAVRPRDPLAIRIGQFVSLAIRVRVIAGGKSSPVSEMERPLSSQISEDSGLRHPFARSCSLRFSPSSLAIASTTSDHPGESPRLFVNDKCVPGAAGTRGVLGTVLGHGSLRERVRPTKDRRPTRAGYERPRKYLPR